MRSTVMMVLLSASLGMLPLSAGSTPDPATCTCARAIEIHGWCEAHGVGMVGPIRIADTTEFEHVAEAIRRLQAANEIAKRCEHCAVASVTDTTCPVCRIAYEDGKPSGDD